MDGSVGHGAKAAFHAKVRDRVALEVWAKLLALALLCASIPFVMHRSFERDDVAPWLIGAIGLVGLGRRAFIIYSQGARTVQLEGQTVVVQKRGQVTARVPLHGARAITVLRQVSSVRGVPVLMRFHVILLEEHGRPVLALEQAVPLHAQDLGWVDEPVDYSEVETLLVPRGRARLETLRDVVRLRAAPSGAADTSWDRA